MTDCKGCIVRHNVLGTGRIVGQGCMKAGRGWIITAEFPSAEQRYKRVDFLYPLAFLDGFLSTEDKGLLAQIQADKAAIAAGRTGMATDIRRDATITGLHVKNANCMLGCHSRMEKSWNPHISLGWSRLGDMSGAGVDGLYSIFEEHGFADEYMNRSDPSARAGVQQVSRFLFDINPGDIVVFFDNPYARFGLVESGYYYHHFASANPALGGDDPDYMSHKDTKWLMSLHYGKLSLPAKRFTYIPKSVFPLDTKYEDKAEFFGFAREALASHTGAPLEQAPGTRRIIPGDPVSRPQPVQPPAPPAHTPPAAPPAPAAPSTAVSTPPDPEPEEGLPVFFK